MPEGAGNGVLEVPPAGAVLQAGSELGSGVLGRCHLYGQPAKIERGGRKNKSRSRRAFRNNSSGFTVQCLQEKLAGANSKRPASSGCSGAAHLGTRRAFR